MFLLSNWNKTYLIWIEIFCFIRDINFSVATHSCAACPYLATQSMPQSPLSGNALKYFTWEFLQNILTGFSTFMSFMEMSNVKLIGTAVSEDF